jgi:hypothetical protein
MGVTGVGGAGKDVKTESQLPDPAQSLVIKSFQDAVFDTVESDVAVDIVEDDFFIDASHFFIVGEAGGLGDERSVLAHPKASRRVRESASFDFKPEN